MFNVVMSQMPTGQEIDGFGFILIFYLLYVIFMMAVAVAAYVLRGWGLYRIARRREIRMPWLAWIPIGEMWLKGCISDQYQFVVKGKVKNKRKTLLTLNILTLASAFVLFVLWGMLLVYSAGVMDYWNTQVPDALMGRIMIISLAALADILVLTGLSIWMSVVQYMAFYDLFRSCDPQNSVLYLVLAIFFPIALPVFLFVCRNKDLGMPPRKSEPVLSPEYEAPISEE